MDLGGYPCPHCGAALEEAGAVLRCTACGISCDPAAAEEYAREKELPLDSLSWDDYAGAGIFGDAVYGECGQCGTVFAFPAESAPYIGEAAGSDAARCPFCDSVLSPVTSGAPTPDIMLPFVKDRQAAQDAFVRFCRFKPLLPAGFVSHKRVNAIKKVYLPYWVTDCTALAKLRFDAQKSHTKRSGGERSIKTDAFMAIREGTAAYSGVYSCASPAGKKCCAAAEPFDAAAAQPFEGGVPEAYIVVADSPAQQAHAAAEERIRRSMERLLADTVKGFSEKKRQAGRLEINGAKTQLALFPVWIISTKYKTKTYRFVMNAHTGRAYGEIPFSKAKMAGIFAAVTAGVALIGTALTLLL